MEKKELIIDNEDYLYNAMKAAHDAFRKHFEDQDLDSSYFSLYLTGYVLDEGFRKLSEIRTCMSRTGFEEFQYPDREEKDG